MSGDTKIKSMGAIPHTGGVEFHVRAPNAQRVSVIGTFNDWDGGKHRMQVEENGHCIRGLFDRRRQRSSPRAEFETVRSV
jgi:Carbohydrate-binding module 48 (Isoamylase N-terminal domain)